MAEGAKPSLLNCNVQDITVPAHTDLSTCQRVYMLHVQNEQISRQGRARGQQRCCFLTQHGMAVIEQCMCWGLFRWWHQHWRQHALSER